MKEEGRLTPAEQEIMLIFWNESREMTIQELIEKLPPGRAYTTIATLVRILEQKEVLSSQKLGKKHYYTARMERKTYVSTTLKNLVRGLFGSPASLVRHLVESDDLSSEELAEIRRLVKGDEP